MSEHIKCPAVPVAILNLFSNDRDFAAIAGDLVEEFQQRTQHAGLNAARLWYWREAIRTGLILTWREVVRTPFRTLLMALACLLVLNVITSVYFVGLHFWSRRAERDFIIPFQFIAAYATGYVSAKLLPNRECALAMSFIAISLPGPLLSMYWTRVIVPADLFEIGVLMFGARFAAFAVGCLWVRHWRIANPRSIN